MNRRDWESRIALMMLPVGAIITLGALIAAAEILVTLADTVLHWPVDGAARVGWCVAGTLVVAIDVRKGIETMATFDWRVPIAPLVLSVALAASWPGWWS